MHKYTNISPLLFLCWKTSAWPSASLRIVIGIMAAQLASHRPCHLSNLLRGQATLVFLSANGKCSLLLAVFLSPPPVDTVCLGTAPKPQNGWLYFSQAQWLMALVPKQGNLSSIPGTHSWEEGDPQRCYPLTSVSL